MSTRNEMYRKATEAIIGMLEEGRKAKFEQPWEIKGAKNAITGNNYSGVNTLILGTADSPSGLWGTYPQWKSIGAQVKKGNKSSTIFFYERRVKEVETDDGETEDKVIFICKKWNVFSDEQVEGFEIPEERLADTDNKERIEEAEAFFSTTQCKLTDGLDRAYYSPSGN